MATCLPAGVIRQWTSWCKTPDYVRGALGRSGTGHHLLTLPMHFFDVTDDAFAPERPAAELRRWYSAATATHTRLTPADFGARAVGHFGVFRAGLGEPLWERVRAVLVTGQLVVPG